MMDDAPDDPTGPGDAAAALAKLRAAQSASPPDAASALAKLRAGPSASAAGPAAPPKNSSLYDFVNTADNALTMGLGQKFNAGVTALSDKIRGRDSFTNSYKRNLAQEHQGIDDFRAEHPVASGIAAGMGGVVPALVAGPAAEEGILSPALSRGARVLNGTKVGAGVGAVNALGNSQNTNSVGDQFSTAAMGALEGGAVGGAATTAAETFPLASRILKAKTPGAAAIDLQDANTAANIENYGKVSEEQQANPTTPSVRTALDHPTIQPFADKFRASQRGQDASDSDVLRNAVKGMTRNQLALQQRMAAKIGDYDYDAELQISDLKAAKKVARDAMASASQVPAKFLDVPAEVHETDPVIIPGREPMTGPILEGTAGRARGNQSQVAIDPNGSATSVSPRDVQGPAGPAFMLREQPEKVVSPGVRIETPAMRIQTAPPRDVPASAPSFPAAEAEKARMARSEEMLRNGADAANRLIQGTRSTGKNLTKTTPEAFLRNVGQMSGEDTDNSLAGVLAEAKRNVGLTSNLKTGFGVGPSLRALRVSPFVKALDAQAGTQPTSNAPALSASIIGGAQSLADLLRNAGITSP